MAQRGGPRHRSDPRRVTVALVSGLVAVGAAGGVAYRLGWADSQPERPRSPAVVAEQSHLPAMRFAPVPTPAEVLAPVDATAPAPRRRGVRAAVGRALSDRVLGSHVGLVVRDLTHSRELFSINGADRFVPASTTKLFTVAAALAVLEPSTRFATQVVSAGNLRRIVLVGGGDPLLARRTPAAEDSVNAYPPEATLSRLAAATARVLRGRAVTSVRLGLDATLFRGPTASRSWDPGYVGDVVSPITALWVDEGRVPDSAVRSPDPVMAAGEAFAAELGRRGITVRGELRVGSAPSGAQPLASVRSAPLSQIAEHVLAVSDNDAAEVLLRHVARAQRNPPTFTGGARAVRQVLTRVGLDLSRVVLNDGSGLSRNNRVPLQTLVDLLDLAARRPALRPLITDLPVAGFSGSLGYRFVVPGTEQARGLVRTKTGTLSHVALFAGTVRAASGSVLEFALAADRVRLADTLEARNALDRVASALAGCGCR